MHNPVAFEVEYREVVRQLTWINENDWRLDRPPARPVRPPLARAIAALARTLPIRRHVPRTAA
jgi:hypothetical protein